MSDTKATSSTIAPAPLTFQEKMAAGAIARGVAQSTLHPVDVVRTRLQARGVQVSWKPSVFIKGFLPQFLLAIPAGATQFVAFEYAKEKLVQFMPDENLSTARALLAGAFGATAAATFRVPQEVLKQRIQADIYPNIVVALRETVGKQGIGSLYNGALATISRDVPWNALSFMFHSQAKTIFKSVKGRAPANDENLALAGISGAVAAIIMTPVDVVKTRIMTAKAGTATAGIIGTLKNIIAEEGAGTLMKGVVPRIVFLAPLAGITFSVYEAVAERIRQRKADAAAVSSQIGSTVHYLGQLTDQQLQPSHPYRQIGSVGLRFAKRSVSVASAQSKSGMFMGDYQPSSCVSARFTLPLC